MIKPELKSLIASLIIPFVLCFIVLMVKILEVAFGLSFADYGVNPLNFKKIYSIFSAPFIHSDFKHLMSNIVPLFFLTGGLMYFYKEISYKVLIFIYVLSGLMVWFMGQEYSIHIGASGIVYGLISFHLTSALLRKRKDLTAFSFVIILLYGGFVWGFFPIRNISWEAHLSGAICGLAIALYFKNEGPQKQEHQWLDENDDDENAEWKINDNTIEKE